jgi:hypothetical protein
VEVKIQLSPEYHEVLLHHAPEGSIAHRVLSRATEVRAYRDRSLSKYEVDCDEAAAKSLLRVAREHCPEAAVQIEFALRVAVAKLSAPRGRPRS